MSKDATFNPIASLPLVHSLTKAVKVVRRFQSRRFVIAVRIPDDWRKIFQVIFNPSDGSIFVNIPYSSIETGILSEGKLPSLEEEVKFSMEERGKVTSKLVKYSHHPDGRAHFSQSGHVRTEISRQSVPLTRSHGHIFTVQFQDIHQFDKARVPQDEEPPAKERSLLTFNFESYCPLALKFVGWWHHVNEFGHRTEPGKIGPKVVTQKPDGTRSQSFLMGSMEGDPFDQYVLTVSCEPRPLIDVDVPAALNVIGGFDEASQEGAMGELNFLCAAYPASDYESLRQRIGSIDLFTNPNSKLGANAG